MIILAKDNESLISQYENFVKTHENGSFMQSIKWTKVKNEWNFEIILSLDKDQNIIGSMLVLIKTVPFLKCSLLYSPRGPVCDLYDKNVLGDLLSGVQQIAENHNAYEFKIDPFILEGDQEFVKISKELGFTHKPNLKDFETIQTRHNYMLLDLKDKTCDEIFAAFHNKWRYNIRVALKHNIQCVICDKTKVEDFYKIYKMTGKRDGFTCRPISYFVKMLDSLGDNVCMFICYYNDIPVSGAITTYYGNKACYVYGASDSSYRNVMPNHIMQWTMIQKAKEKNCDIYDFQGIPVDMSDNSSMYGVYKFKKGFNGECVLFAGEFDYTINKFNKKLVENGISTLQKIKKIIIR
ncbi:MAG: lipid II:glycine glycyltransferase FemX [Oscillospiraceae bacterium]